MFMYNCCCGYNNANNGSWLWIILIVFIILFLFRNGDNNCCQNGCR